MSRAQCIVHRADSILMVYQLDHWCLPGGAIEPDEMPEDAALRELDEECGVAGRILCQTSWYPDTRLSDRCTEGTLTFLVDIGTQEPRLGHDPELPPESQVIVAVEWLTLASIPERDRAFLWESGLLGIEPFFSEVVSWGDRLSYPGDDPSG